MNIIYSISILLLGLLIFYFYWLRRERKAKKNIFNEDKHDFEAGSELALTVKNPDTAYAHWDKEEITEDLRNEEKNKLVFSLYDITEKKEKKISFLINFQQEDTFIEIPEADKMYYAEVGFFNQNDNFIILATSKAIKTPPDSLSKQRSGFWLEIKDNRKIYTHQTYQALTKESQIKHISSPPFDKQ